MTNIYSEGFNITKWQLLLTRINACYEARCWVDQRNQKQTWEECPNGSWLQWVLDDLHWREHLSNKHLKACNEAIRTYGTGVKPADRIRAVVPYSAFARALTELRKSYKDWE